MRRNVYCVSLNINFDIEKADIRPEYRDEVAKVGDFMKKKVFEPGRTLSWNGLTKHATGDSLNARAFAADFKGKE